MKTKKIDRKAAINKAEAAAAKADRAAVAAKVMADAAEASYQRQVAKLFELLKEDSEK